MSPKALRPDAARVYGPLLAGVSLALLVGALAHAVLGVAVGPEEELLTALKDAEGEGLTLELPGIGTLVSTELRYARITVHAEPEARTARAVATLDFTGTLGKTKVSSLGLERVPFRHEGGAWRPERGLAPELSRIVELLERRRRAVESADVAGLRALLGPSPPDEAVRALEETAHFLSRIQGRRYDVLAWYIRSERDLVLVTESFRLRGTLPERPVEERGERSFRLVRGEAGYFFSEPPR